MNKEEQYSALYFPEDMIPLKEEAYFALLDIDCNFSKLIQVLLPEIRDVAKDIRSKGKNYRHFHWSLNVEEKGKHETRKEKNN